MLCISKLIIVKVKPIFPVYRGYQTQLQKNIFMKRGLIPDSYNSVESSIIDY